MKSEYRTAGRLFRTNGAQMALALVVSLVVLAPRINNSDFLGRLLWGEDGRVFYGEAERLGVRSVWTLYSGYLHLYPRLVALLASRFDLALLPLIYLAGWFATFVLMARVVIGRLIGVGVEPWVALAVVAFIGLQPHSAETFFTLTNGQWFLAIALAVLLLVDVDRTPEWKDVLLIFLLGLTGPFAVLLVPVLVLKLALLRDFQRHRASYLAIVACALIQGFFVARSGGQTAQPTDPDPSHWVAVIKTFLTFGGGERTVPLAVAFWGIFALVLVVAVFKPASARARTSAQAAGLLTFAGLLFFAAALWSLKDQPAILSPIGPGGRYFVVPYALVLVAIGIISAYRPSATLVQGIVFGLICVLQFRTLDRPPNQFQAFAAFAKGKSHLIIPINPRWPEYPGWHVPVDTVTPVGLSPLDYDLRVEYLDLEVADSSVEREGLHLRSSGNDPRLFFKGRVDCGGSRFAGVEAKLWRNAGDWVQLFWSHDGAFSERESLIRFYPAGSIQAQFAFPNTSGGFYLRLDALSGRGEFTLRALDIYCVD